MKKVGKKVNIAKRNNLIVSFLFVLMSFASVQVKAHTLTLSSTRYHNKVVVDLCESYNACYWIGGGWSRIDWYVNGAFYDSDQMNGMALGYQTIRVENKAIDCSHLNPGTTVNITAKIYHHDAFTFGYWGDDLVASQTLLPYTNVSNVQASDALYMTKVKVTWDSNEMFDSHAYSIQKNGQTVSGNLPAGTNSYMHSSLAAGTSGDYRVKARVNDNYQYSTTNQGSTFDPNMQGTTDLDNTISLTWNNTGNTYQASGFYLDWFNNETGIWEFLWEREDNIYNSKTDNGSEHELIPGYTYQYRLQVKPVGVSDVVAYASGKTLPNGQISGYVRTPLPNQVPVPGVEVQVQLVGNALPTDTTTTYTAVTNADGYYEINQIYYYTEADFQVTPIYQDRTFDPENMVVTLNTSANTATADFNDLSSFAISGNIMLESCPIAGVNILVDNDTTAVVTDTDGNYVVTVPSGGTYEIAPAFGDHLFEPNVVDVIVSDDVTGVDFNDTTVFFVHGYLSASCNTPIGQGDIRFYSMDDSYCFDQTVSTDASGYYSIVLPAAKYRVNVPSFTSSDEDLVSSIDVMAYFSVPEVLDVTHADTINFHNDTTEFNLTYRLDPTLAMGGLSYVQTCSGEPVSLVRQYEPSIIEFTANEEFNGYFCPASDGYIIIRENVSSIGMGENVDTLFYEMGETIEYELIPGTPNLIADQDYLKYFEAVLVRDGQTDTIYKDVVVLGHNPREQNYTTVTPQIPFHILHNPPGDASYSFLQENQSVSSSFTQSFLQEGSVDTYVRAQLGSALSIGFAIGVDASIDIETQLDITTSLGTGSSGLTEWASMVTTTMSEEYQTSGNINITGNSGDVYIGGAMNMLYGVTDVLEYNFNTCEFEQAQTLFMQPQGIETTFMYTESHVLDVVIPELQNITDYYTSINEVDSAAYFENQLSVWQQFVERNHETIENSPEVENISFSGGVGYTNTLETTNSSSTSFDFNIYVDYGVAVDAGLAVGGAGVFGGVAVHGRSTWGSVVATETTNTTTVGYYLGDDDENDDYSVQVLEDQVYGVPAFRLVSGQSSCPWEEGTVPREGVQLSTDVTYQSVEENESAVFVLHLANTSQTDEEMTYDLIFDHTSNPNGAEVSIGGSPVVGDVPYPYTIPAWGSVDVTITIDRGPTAFDYNGLKFILKSQCDDDISDETFLNVHYYKEYDLTVAVDGVGTTNLEQGVHTYIEESNVNLYASAGSGYVFDHWVLGEDIFETAALAVVMDSDKAVTAYFVETTESQYNVSVSLVGNGTTNPPPGDYIFNEGTELNVIANPDLYNAFVQWNVNGEVLTDAISSITITEDMEIEAEFIVTHQFDISTTEGGSTNPEAGYYAFNHGQEISLFASPELGYAFDHWEINGVDYFTQYITVIIDEAVSATAYFVETTQEQHSLDISSFTEGGHTIPPTGTYLYVDGDQVDMTAVPDEGYVFDKWIINGIESTNNPVNMTITGDMTVSAYFAEDLVAVDGVNYETHCSLFPNPSEGIVEILSNEPIRSIKVLSIAGKILSCHDGNNAKRQNLNLEAYKSGIYLVQIKTDHGVETMKLQLF